MVSPSIYYECHVTLSRPTLQERLVIESIANDRGYHTSEIVGDDVMGDKTWFYCTKRGFDYTKLGVDMTELCLRLRERGIQPRRQKIEAILVDDVLS